MRNLPPPLCDYTFIPDPESYIESLGEPFPLYVRLNTLKGTEKEIEEALRENGFSCSPVPGLPEFRRVDSGSGIGDSLPFLLGLIYAQSITSAMPVAALAPSQGETILDLCAAPGGKTTYLSQAMKDTGLVVANDRKMGRLTALTANIKRMGCTNTVVTFYRGEMFPLPPDGKGLFDAVLVDAPCSGEGKYKLDTEGRLLFKVPGKTNLPAIQKGLIVRGFDLLRPGGRLVYSTCTLNPLENEGVVDYLLKRREGEVLSWEPPLPAREGIPAFFGHVYDSRVSRCRRFYPHEVRGTGFFVALIGKPE